MHFEGKLADELGLGSHAPLQNLAGCMPGMKRSEPSILEMADLATDAILSHVSLSSSLLQSREKVLVRGCEKCLPALA